MAVPKNKRSKSKVKQRTNIIFFDQLCGNWRRRREWYQHYGLSNNIILILLIFFIKLGTTICRFYRRLSIEKFLPPNSEGNFGANRPVLFPGFWSSFVPNGLNLLKKTPK